MHRSVSSSGCKSPFVQFWGGAETVIGSLGKQGITSTSKIGELEVDPEETELLTLPMWTYR